MSDAHQAARRRETLEQLWGSPPGLRGALTAVNHTVIGRRFMFTAFFFFLVGGVLAMLIRAQLAQPHTAWLGPAAYSQVFTMHGTVMMFLFAIPMIEGFALYMLPKLLGARDLAFPRLSAFGYWCYLFGGAMILVSMLVGFAPDSGWFMYTPLSSKPYSPGINADVWLLGVTFVEVSALCAAIEFMATVLKVRCAGMALNRMPILVWYLWVTAAMMLFGFPPLILGSVLLELERAFDWPFFDPERGGDPLLWQHLFWLFGHPEVYIIFLPGAGVVSTVLPVFARRPLVGYAWIVAALVALGFLSFGLWVHHMFTTGIPHLSLAFFSVASLMVVIPTAVQIFAWLSTLLLGRPQLEMPMLYIYGFLAIFVLGGLTGVMVAVVPFDWQAHDTHFVVAHLHYVLIGGFVFPMLAAAYYWLPHLTGRRQMKGVGHGAFWLIFLGFNLTFLPMHLTGLLGMPRRVHTYDPEMGWGLLNLTSSIGGFVTAIGFGLFLIDVLQRARFGRPARRNPWQAGTLEWAMPLPPPAYNFASLPQVSDREPGATNPNLISELAEGRGHLAEPRNGWRETLGVDMLDGRPDQVILLPGPTLVPLFTALSAGVFFLSFLFEFYWGALAGVAAVVVWGWIWLWESGLKEDTPALDIGDGRLAAAHPAHPAPPTWWGLVFTLMANGTFFGALVFGYLFLWVVTPGEPPALMSRAPLTYALAIGAGLAGLGAAWAAFVANRDGRPGRRDVMWLASALCGLVVAAALLAALFVHGRPPSEHAYAAAVAFLSGYAAFLAAMAVLFSAYGLMRARRGWISPQRAVEARALALWWAYTAGVVLVTALLIQAPSWSR